MVVTRRFVSGSESGLGQGDQEAPVAPEVIDQEGPVLIEDRVREIIHEEEVELVRGQIPELFGSIKTAMMEYFDDRYAALAETDAAAVASAVTAAGGGVGFGRGFQYRDFDNTKLLNFDGTQDPVKAMRWVFDVEGCFFTCSCHTD